LLEAVGSDIDAWSPGVRTSDTEAVERLTWALAVRGIATGVAGTTACLSGVEHLVSHMLDLYHGERGLPIGCTALRSGSPPSWPPPHGRCSSTGWRTPHRRTSTCPHWIEATARDRVQKAFADLDPTGRIGAECWSDYSRKLDTCAGRQDSINRTWRPGPTMNRNCADWAGRAPGSAPDLRAAGSAPRSATWQWRPSSAGGRSTTAR
jgi:glycerol-1-phosphate dehydrogenase [NAD(P)+]